MGTSNFQGCGRFGIWAAVEDYDEDFYKEQYPELSDDERWEIFREDSYFWYEDSYNRAKKAVEDLNWDLTFFNPGNVSSLPGCYG